MLTQMQHVDALSHNEFFIKKTFIEVGVEQPHQGSSCLRAKSADSGVRSGPQDLQPSDCKQKWQEWRDLSEKMKAQPKDFPVEHGKNPKQQLEELTLIPLSKHGNGSMHPVEEADEEFAVHSGATLAFASGNFAPPDSSDAQQRRGHRNRRKRGRPLRVEVEQAADMQEVFKIVQRSTEALTYETIVEVLRTAAKKAPEGTRGEVRQQPGFTKCMNALTAVLPSRGQDIPGIPKVIHALGKLEVLHDLGKHQVFTSAAANFLLHTRHLVPNLVHDFSTADLSNCLWGLAKVSCPNAWDLLEPLAMDFVRTLLTRVSSFGPQCKSNSIYSVAVLRLFNPVSRSFVQAIVAQLLSTPDGFNRFDKTQGIANTIWGLAKMPAGTLDKSVIVEMMYAARDGSDYRLAEFGGQEKSNLAWAMGILIEAMRGHARRSQTSPKQGSIERFIVDIAVLARAELHLLSPQSVTNIALALQKAGALGDAEALQYISDAANYGTAVHLRGWKPQAISNFCFVLAQLPMPSRIPGMEEIIGKFADTASCEAYRRIDQFNWQDRSSIINALGKSGFVSQATITLVEEVVRRSYGQCHLKSFSLQSMLNIAVSALEMGISRDLVYPMSENIAEQLAQRAPRGVKAQDTKQWGKVQRLLNGI